MIGTKEGYASIQSPSGFLSDSWPTHSPPVHILLTQDRIPGIDLLIPNFHNLYNELQVRWRGRFPKFSDWKGLKIPIATTADPRSYQSHSQYMEWVIEQNTKSLARLSGWGGAGYASDYLRTAGALKAADYLKAEQLKADQLKAAMRINIGQKFERQDAPSILQPADFTKYVQGMKKPGLISQTGLHKREEGMTAGQSLAKISTPTEEKILRMFDKFFNWLNRIIEGN